MYPGMSTLSPPKKSYILRGIRIRQSYRSRCWPWFCSFKYDDSAEFLINTWNAIRPSVKHCISVSVAESREPRESKVSWNGKCETFGIWLGMSEYLSLLRRLAVVFWLGMNICKGFIIFFGET